MGPIIYMYYPWIPCLLYSPSIASFRLNPLWIYVVKRTIYVVVILFRYSTLTFHWSRCILRCLVKQYCYILDVCAWLIRRVLNRLIGFIDTWFTQVGTTALSLIYILYISPLYTHYVSQSSLVVSWQRICNSHTVISNHTWSLSCTV
jgi:hypothetical protein